MRKTALAAILSTIGLAGFTSASAQSQASSSNAPTAPKGRQLYDASQFQAPIGHRQPRPAEIKPPEQVLTDPMDDLERENAMLARRIGGICRGC